MSAAIKPLNKRVAAVKEEPQTKTASGLYLPQAAKEKSAVAKVVAVGKDVKEVKVGERIIHKEYSATTVKIDGAEYLIVSEEDILAVLTK